ncbi:CDC48 family AAA ATPase [Candidatus Woesearchaeota archaeon]|nr:CDC48 family AAA ATPase [Candidatus Woesearchaeota archaeon]
MEKKKLGQDLQLKVAEAIQDDVNKGIVRIDSGIMQSLGMRVGDIVEIEGERKSVAISDRAYPGDIGLNIIRMDGIVRRNAKAGIGEMVAIRKVDIKEAKKVTIAPARKGIMIRASSEIFKQGLLGRAVVKGDVVALGGTRRRRSAMVENPFFEDVFSILDESMMGFGFGDIRFIVVDTQPKQAVIIGEQTEVVFNPEAVEVSEEEVPEVSYEDIGGLDEEIKKVREMVELPLKHPEIFERLGIEPPKGVLLHGPPGTGKTLLAKAVANETNAHFILINGPEVMSKYYGQSEQNIRDKFKEAEKNAPSIVFIDEIDAIATKREDTRGEVERRVVAQLLANMDGLQSRGKVIVIAASNVPNMLDPALRRPGRFDREIEIGVPSKEGRLKILKIHSRNMPIGESKKLYPEKDREKLLKKMAEITYGFVGADLAALTKEAAMVVLRRVLPDLKLKEDEPIPKELLEELMISQDDFKEALKVVRPSALREVLIERPNTKWEDIGGLINVKQELKEAVEWPLKNPEVFTRLGVRAPKGILLYGAPGTGKTMLAKAVASESDANFILVKGPELLSKWVGESEKAVREVFKKARQTAPTIVFFDEVDSLAPRRGGLNGDSHVTERVVNQLLTEIDGLEEMNDVVVLAASNRPDIIDTALLRPGRFDRLILVPAPDENTRLEIFQVHSKGMPLRGVSLESLAKKTEGYAGADIEAVCREAAMTALRNDIKAKEVGEKEFDEALKRVPPSVTKDIEKTYEELGKHFSSARARQMKEERPSYMG